MRRALLATVGTAIALGSVGIAPLNQATAATSSDVRVGSFNIASITFDQNSGEQAVWKQRRAVVASQILSEHLDVVGVQEANVSSIYKDRLVTGPNQFTDLKNALNERGGHYELTTTAAYNCVNPASTYKCVYKYQKASADNRILYNTDTLTMRYRGSMTYKAQTAGKYERALAWAVFRVKATGKEFIFTDTHLDPYTPSVRVKEWKEAIAKGIALQGTSGRPIIAVGDYNTTKFSDWAQEMLPYTKAKGFGDVLNREYKVNPVRNPRAQTTTNGTFSTFNGYKRAVNCYCAQPYKTGNNIDWVFATNRLPVKEWNVVANYNPATMQYQGVLPSDHNLVQVTLTL